MHLPDSISLAIPVFRRSRRPTGTGISLIRESGWHGIRREPERHRYAPLTPLVMPTCRVLLVKIKPAAILGVDAQRSQALRAGSPIHGKVIPAVTRSRTQLTRT